ncbi:MAG: methyltransferase domain-containing protein [Gemmatimonadetes bacterium]|nr:methyltransferase domain-containing protein [Gemmatimonadota bacterium]
MHPAQIEAGLVRVHVLDPPHSPATGVNAFERAIRRARNQLFKAVFSGEGCSCMFCGKSYRRFLHQGVRADVFKKHRVSGAGFKKNVRCPNCGSNQRTRLLHLFFEFRTEIYEKDVRVLHISPKRPIARELRRHQNIDHVCGALFPERFAEFRAVRLDVTDIEFADGEFDVVICNHVLEHVREDETAMKEIYRVLTPGGFAVLQVPLALDLAETLEDPKVVEKRERIHAYGQKDHLRLYGLDYFDRLRNAGFRVSRDNPFKNQWVPDVENFCLDKDEDIFLGSKD